MAVEVTFVRHGESESNVRGTWQGQGDSPLSGLGREQAQLLSARLAEQPFDVVVSSDLSRAHETAKAVASRWHADVRTGAQWREIDVGRWDGLTRPQVLARFPAEVAALARGEMVAIGGGESWADLEQRASAALAALLAELQDGQRAIVFSHGGLIASVVRSALGLSMRRPRRIGNVNNTGLTTLRFEAGGRSLPKGDFRDSEKNLQKGSLTRYNDTLHLGPLGKWSEERLKRGCTVVAVHESLPETYEPPERTYSLDDLGGDVNAALGRLVADHPGARVGLVVDAKTQHGLVSGILEAERLGAAQGVTHVVASKRGHTLAELNCV